MVTKATDVSSTKLLNEAYQGEGQDVTIDFCKTDKGKLEVYLTITLNNTMISGHSIPSGRRSAHRVSVFELHESRVQERQHGSGWRAQALLTRSPTTSLSARSPIGDSIVSGWARPHAGLSPSSWARTKRRRQLEAEFP